MAKQHQHRQAVRQAPLQNFRHSGRVLKNVGLTLKANGHGQ